MKQAGEIRRVVAAGSRALAIGRTPVCWREGLKQATARLGALRRSCAWLETGAGQAPKLRSEPLFGRRLAELVGQPAQRDETDRPRQAKSFKPPPCEPPGAGAAHGQSERRRDVTCPPARPKADRREPPDRSDPCSHPDAARVTGLPKRADGALLAQCADEHSARSDRTPGDRRAAPDRTEHFRRDAYVDRARAGKQAGKMDSTWRTVEALRPNIVRDSFNTTGRAAAPQERPGGQLHVESESSLFETLAPKLIGRAQTDSRNGSLASRRADGRLSDHLGAPWSTDLAGPTAPADLLHRLAGLDQLRPSHDSAHVASSRNGAQSDRPSPLPGDRESREVAPQASRAAARPGESRESVHSQREPDESPPAASDDVSRRATDGRRAVGRTPERIAPPSLAESLPPLAPLQTATTRVLPLASETARRGALNEAAAPEDLDALAAKIKLILDEQARRHGIDV